MHGPNADSKQVFQTQAASDIQLRALVRKHIVTGFKKPFQAHNVRAFDRLQSLCRAQDYKYLILDSGCGTGMSTQILADLHPDALVVGLDQSESRLSRIRSLPLPENAQLIRANCEDLWRLCIINNLTFDAHYLLYPNPWPKPKHLKRRWHGHPVFPHLGVLSHHLELRSNWYTYLTEFNTAWHQLSGQWGQVERLQIQAPLTLFEKKYHQSGHPLYRLVLNHTNTQTRNTQTRHPL